MENIPQKLTDITFSEKYLYLNCLRCKEIPLLFINEQNPEKIDIKCDKCNTELQLDLEDYLSFLSSENLLKNKNNHCISHNNYFDIFCFKCHIQYCSKCEINKVQHSDHIIHRIKKKINLKTIEDAKNSIKTKKDYFKKYISDFINEKLPKIPKNRHYFIINNLMETYVNSMKNFFLFCDNILLNYDPEYPDYYQQNNLINFLRLLDKTSPLINLKETKFESILIYSNNNFINKKKNNNNVILNDLIDLSNNKISNALFIDDEYIILAFEDISLKIYNYQNKNYIKTIGKNFGEKDIKYKGIKLSQIYKSIFAVILNTSKLSVIKLYSINKNTLNYLLFQTVSEIDIIRKINNNSLGISFQKNFNIYSVDNFENILQKKKNTISKFEISKTINTPKEIRDFIKTSDDLYIIIACFDTIYIYASDNFSIFKEIKLPVIDQINYDSINIIDDNKIIFYGKNISIFTINDSSFKLLYGEKIMKKQDSYLVRIWTYLNYSNVVLAYNKLIFNRQLKTIYSTSFENDTDSTVVEKALYICDYNPESNKVILSQKLKDLRVVNIYKNYNNEIIIVQEKKVSILLE